MSFNMTNMDSYFKEAEKDIIYDLTNNGKCSECGSCCSNILVLNDKEIRNIHKYIKRHHIEERVTKGVPSAYPSIDMTCPFLDTSKEIHKCNIYEVRPEICRVFLCNDSNRCKRKREELSTTRKRIDMRGEFFNHPVNIYDMIVQYVEGK